MIYYKSIEMKKVLLYLLIIIVFGSIGFYFEFKRSTHIDPNVTVVKKQNPVLKSTTLKKKTQQSSPRETLKVANTEQNVNQAEVEVKDNTPNWLDETQKVETKPKRTDPFSDHIAEIKTIEDGTFIDDPETMDTDEYLSAMYKQMLKKFGDIPAVHAYMDYQKKWDYNEPMTIQEEIAGLEATMALYPNESTRKTIAYNKWMLSKGAHTITDHIDMTAEDIEYLLSVGISIETKVNSKGNYVTTVSTK